MTISSSTLEESLNLHRASLLRNSLVKPIAGTMVDQIVESTPAFYKDIDAAVAEPIVDKESNYEKIEIAVDTIEAHLSSYQDVYDAPVKLLIEQKAQEVSSVVTEHLKFVKNLVNPIGKQFISAYRELVKDPIDPASEFMINKINYSPVLTDPSWCESLANEYKNAPELNNGNIPQFFSIPVMTYAQVCEKVMDFYPNKQQEIFNYFESIGSNRVMYTLGGFFGWPQEKMNLSAPTNEDTETILFLFCTSMYNNPLEGTAHSLAVFNNYMKIKSVQTGYNLAFVHMKNYVSKVKNTQIIARNNNSEIFVYSDMYNNYISAGGDDYTLLGFCVAKEHVFNSTIQELKLNALKYEEVWKKYVRNKTNEYEFKSVARAKEAYEFLAFKVYKENIEQIDAYNKEAGYDPAQVLKNYEAMVKKNKREYSVHMFTEAERMTMELFIHMFPQSCAYDIYKIALDTIIFNPELQEQDVWQLTMYTYVCNYVFSQVLVYKP